MLDAFHIAAVGSRHDLRLAIADASPSGRALLKAVIAQFEGDVPGAVRMLQRLIATLKGFDRAAVADTLAPIFVMRHENVAVLVLADVLQDGGWVASAHAFRALVYADTGKHDAARRHADLAHLAISTECNDVIRFRVLQRLARTAFYLHDYERAVDLALTAAKLSLQKAAWRSAAAAYSIAYTVHYNVTGDFGEADRYAQLCTLAATKSKDESFLHTALVSEYDLAVQFADAVRAERLEREIKASLLPEQYTERYPFGLSYALVRGADDLVAMRTLLQTLRAFPGRSRGEWALCTALVALSQAAESDDEHARESTHEAISYLGRITSSDPAYEQYYRRLARASVAATRVLLGDNARAARTMETKESMDGLGEERLPELMRDGRLSDAAAHLRGVARVFARAHNSRINASPPAGLTIAEFEVLRLLGHGWSAGRIARETHRSVNTVYNHTRAILSKLEVSRAPEAVACARARGLLL